EEMGRAMARVLMEEITSRSTAKRHVVLGTRLVRRDSA
ncbi:MAG TPA: LacI family transcriptional regulator, partial [Streptomyces sp.]|nr:LacI family transcriptional regulator [Streptomyces sp.]